MVQYARASAEKSPGGGNGKVKIEKIEKLYQ